MRDEPYSRALSLTDFVGIQKPDGPKLKPLSVRFWGMVKKGGSEECWNWTGYIPPNSYGSIRIPGPERRQERAHRVSYVLHKGSIPEGLYVLHRCDNMACVNPAHLFLGTQSDNIRDAKQKGRLPRGENHPDCSVSEITVKAIRADYASGNRSKRKLSEKYGVNVRNVVNIIYRKSWTHI